MRILGIDYGSKRVGVALSDELQAFAQPYLVLKNSKTLLEDVKGIMDKEAVGTIVIGESKDFKGKDNEIMIQIRDFKTKLEQTLQIPVIFEPEFLSSHQAQYFQGKTELLDASAAAIILQSYLDRIKNK